MGIHRLQGKPGDSRHVHLGGGFPGDYALARQVPEGEPMQDEGYYGVIEPAGKWVLPPEYAEILSQSDSGDYAGGRDTGIYLVVDGWKKDSKAGFFDIPSGFFSDLIFDDVEMGWTNQMDEELICVEVNNLKGFVRRTTGEIVISCQFDPIYRYGFDGDYCAALPADCDDPDKRILFDRQGRKVPLPENCCVSNDSMVIHCEDLIRVRNVITNLYGFIDVTGRLAIPCQYLHVLFKAASAGY